MFLPVTLANVTVSWKEQRKNIYGAQSSSLPLKRARETGKEESNSSDASKIETSHRLKKQKHIIQIAKQKIESD